MKKIFSIQTISLIIALFAAYFTYRAYEDNKPGQLTVEFPILNNEMDEISYIDASGIKRYFNLGFYVSPPVSINDGRMGGPLNMLLFPIISNDSKKSLKDFTAEIYIWSDEPMHKLFQDSKDDAWFLDLTNYSIKSEDSYSIHLSFNKNTLPPNCMLPHPLRCFLLYKASDEIASLGGNVVFTYHITYDGAKEPLSFVYSLRMFYDGRYDDNEDGFPDNFKSYAAYKYLDNEVFRRREAADEGEWVFIMQNRVYRNLKHMTSAEFEELEDKSYTNLQER